jgi:hypothetical protein
MFCRDLFESSICSYTQDPLASTYFVREFSFPEFFVIADEGILTGINYLSPWLYYIAFVLNLNPLNS